MSFAVASLRASAPIEILNTAEVATSFPNFLDVAAAAGLKVQTSGDPS
jgi:3-phosphoshikimate 1-carboxyvinyltransferase